MAAKPSSYVHEFLMASFTPGIEEDRRLAIMNALGHHLSRCEGLVEREFFRGRDGQWVEHVVWASQAALDASTGIEEDAVLTGLFDCFDTRTVAYACCERIETDGIDAVAGAAAL
jgi:hypothetical protein